MKKNIYVAMTVAALTLATASTAFAQGWKSNNTGSWYEYDDGTYVTNGLTPDGYYVNADGYWNGMENDVTAPYVIAGDRLFKTTAFTKSADGLYTITADVYDTAFFDEATLKSFKKGDQITLPGLGVQLTVKKLHKSVVSKADSRISSLYKVECEDGTGTKYYLLPGDATKRNADGNYEAILRPVATGITFTFNPSAHAAITVTGFNTVTSEQLIESTTMYYKLNFPDGSTEANAIWDSEENHVGEKGTAQGGILNTEGQEPGEM